jgi:hypothetical protein
LQMSHVCMLTRATDAHTSPRVSASLSQRLLECLSSQHSAVAQTAMAVTSHPVVISALLKPMPAVAACIVRALTACAAHHWCAAVSSCSRESLRLLAVNGVVAALSA